MIYYGLDGKERKSQVSGLPLGAVLLSAYLKNGNKVRAIISADYGKLVTGIIDCSKPINTLVIKEGEV